MNKMIKQILLISMLMSLSFTSAYTADFKNGVTHINHQELAEKIKDPNVILIDIRTKEEVNEGFIAGAVHIPITGIAKDISLLDEYIGKDLVFYCHVGARVRSLTDHLQRIDHPSKDKLYHLKGDMRAWRARGNKVQTK